MRMTVMLVWPLLICGTLCLPPVRERVTGLLDAFAWDYCDDLKAAVSSGLVLSDSHVTRTDLATDLPQRKLMLEQWDQIDNHSGRQSWTDLMKKLDLNVLLI
jgi:hypothetical protein